VTSALPLELDPPPVVPDPALPEDDELEELDVPVEPPAPETMAGGLAVVVVLEAS